MSTRCMINHKRSGGTYDSIYCHWDGYPESVGATLIKHYNTEDKVFDLMSLGNISFLGETLSASKAYGEPCQTTQSPVTGEDYTYIFDGAWKCYDFYGKQISLAKYASSRKWSNKMNTKNDLQKLSMLNKSAQELDIIVPVETLVVGDVVAEPGSGARFDVIAVDADKVVCYMRSIYPRYGNKDILNLPLGDGWQIRLIEKAASKQAQSGMNKHHLEQLWSAYNNLVEVVSKLEDTYGGKGWVSSIEDWNMDFVCEVIEPALDPDGTIRFGPDYVM